MSAMDGIGNLRQNGIKPLRSTARAQGESEAPVQRFEVEDMRRGSVNVGGVITGQGEEAGLKSVREQYRGGTPAAKARVAKNSALSEGEQVKKLGQIRKSAVDYEATFVDQLVKEMRPSPMAKTPGGDTFSDIAEQPFRDFLSQNGGLGLADTIVGQVARQEGLEQTLHKYPSIMGLGWRPSISPGLMKKAAGNLTMPVESLKNKAESRDTAPETESRAGVLKSILAGAEKAAGVLKEAKTAAQPRVGLMSGEEISYLYNDANEALV